MNRLASVPALAAVTVMLLAACSPAGAIAPSEPAPSEPITTPVATHAAAPATAVTTAPTEAPAAPPTRVQLETATGHHVTINLLDESGRIVASRSGAPGAGASVPFGEVVARNLDARTVELTWSDTPGDAELGLYVNEAASVVLVIRPEREAGDAIAFDRVLVVEFDRPVDAARLHLGIQEGLDTTG